MDSVPDRDAVCAGDVLTKCHSRATLQLSLNQRLCFQPELQLLRSHQRGGAAAAAVVGGGREWEAFAADSYLHEAAVCIQVNPNGAGRVDSEADWQERDRGFDFGSIRAICSVECFRFHK
ncbi:unnamed protein product [Heligmosomoides polygyrus]|uniref:Uncharacterized protein n=1 Tax=Heligmosomoides polygyrus TaxID=6339 RepID=A0A183G2D3_HELPZ|nr:unnamed protein product [Heligmosomoides polygyrus]